jgi:hypothetical protein
MDDAGKKSQFLKMEMRIRQTGDHNPSVQVLPVRPIELIEQFISTCGNNAVILNRHCCTEWTGWIECVDAGVMKQYHKE